MALLESNGCHRRKAPAILARLLLLAIPLLLAMPNSSAQGPPTMEEYQAKAAFLLNFPKFVEWPRPLQPNEALAICVLGHSPVVSFLSQAMRMSQVGARPFVLREISGSDRASACQILFISRDAKNGISSILKDLEGQSILTVGENDGFAGAGGMINLKLKDDRIHLEIDGEAASRAHLRISSKLLSLADNNRRATR